MKVPAFPVKTIIASVAAGIVFFIATIGSWYTIDQGERGVILRNGKLSGIATPGLGFKIPLIDDVKHISVRDHTFKFEKLEAYSYDQQPATLQVSVTFRVPEDQVSAMYSEYGSLDALKTRVLERRTLDTTKNVFGKFTAVAAIQDRTRLGIEINTAIRQAMQGVPVTITGVQIEEVGFSNAYENSIEQRMLAQVQIETTRQQKDTAVINAEIQVMRAQADADALRAKFTAEADGIKLRGNAEATAIRARAEALASNTNLVSLNAIEKWDGKLPTTQIPGSTLPFIGVK